MTTPGGEPTHALRSDRGPIPTSPSRVLALAFCSAVLAALAGAEPTGHWLGDPLWTGLFGASLSLSLSDARRWTWFPVSILGMAVSGTWLAAAAGLAAVGGTAWFALSDQRRRRWMGALVGLLVAQALVRGRTYGFTGLPTLVVAAGCLPAYVSAYLNTSNRVRRVARAGLAVGVVVVSLLAIFTAVSASRARSRVLRAIDFGEQAVAAVEASDHELATVLLVAAHDELRTIEQDFGQLWLAPGRLVPVLGQHSTALQVMADAGADVALRGAAVMSRLDLESLLPPEGGVNVDMVEEIVPQMNALFATLGDSADRIDKLDLTWIASPASSRIETLRSELDRLDEPVADARNAVAVLPGMLGAEGERRYLVMFMTPSELRAAGGFAGNWAEIIASDGQLEVVDAGRGDDLNDALPDGGATLPDSTVVEPSPGWRVNEVFQNLPAVPDFRWVGTAGAAFFEQATGRTVDTVIAVDTTATARLASLTGPVSVDGRSLGAGELESFLLFDQYTIYEGREEARVRALDQLTRTVFGDLVSGGIRSPFELADIAGDLIDRDHLHIVSFDTDEVEPIASLGADGAFPQPDGNDLLAIRSQNLGENKIDTFLQRDVLYQVLYDPVTGETQASLTIELENAAPADGLPDAVIGNNDQGFDFGTNAMLLQAYTPLGFRNAAVDGQPVGAQLSEEFGWQQISVSIRIPAGETRTVRLDLAGSLDVSDGYRLLIDTQPLPKPETVRLDIRQQGQGEVRSIAGWPGDSAARVLVESDQWVTVPQAE